MANKAPTRLDLLPRVPAEAVLNERQGVVRFVIDREYPIVVDRAEGFVEKISVQGGVVTLTGWVADKAFNVPPPFLFVIGNFGRILDVVVKFSPRSDVARHRGASVDEFGFELNFNLHDPKEEAVSLWLMLQNMEAAHFLTLKAGEIVNTGTLRSGIARRA